MLSEREFEKIQQGSIVKANMYNSSGSDAAGEHYAVILSQIPVDKQFADCDRFIAAAISTNNTIDPINLIPVPPSTGLRGNIVCSWIVEIHVLGITRVYPPIDRVTLLNLMQKVHECRKAKKNT